MRGDIDFIMPGRMGIGNITCITERDKILLLNNIIQKLQKCKIIFIYKKKRKTESK